MSLRVSDKLAWSEGVLLLPQHFQQLDRYHESLLATRLDAIDPLSWGALRIELDEKALQQGVVALREFEGVMPDGTPLSIGSQGTQRTPKPRDLSSHFAPAQKSLRVYLALPFERPAVNNYAQENGTLRYAIAARKLHDASRDDRHAEVNVALPNLSLLLEDESRDGFTCLPIAEIVRDAGGELTLSDKFIPPCLRISASAVVSERLDRLLRLMVGRFRLLRESRRITGENRVEFNAADVTRYLQLNALNGMFPTLHYLARAKDIAPRTAFLLLSQLAGQLATFAPDADMSEPLDFAFDDLGKSLGDAFDLCERLLAASDTERFVSCVLQPQLPENGRHYGDLRDVRIDACDRFFLAVQSPLPRPQVVEELVTRGKVASHGDIDFVLAKNIGGIAIAESSRPPPELPIRPGLVYFDLPNADQDVYWKHVRKDRNLVVWLPPLLEHQATTVRLVGLFRSR